MSFIVQGMGTSVQIKCQRRTDDAQGNRGTRKTTTKTVVPRTAKEVQENQRARRRATWEGKSEFLHHTSTVFRKCAGMATVFAAGIQVAAPAEAGTSREDEDTSTTTESIDEIWEH